MDLFIAAALITSALSAGTAFADEGTGVTCAMDTEAKTLTIDIEAGALTPGTKADLVIMRPGKELVDSSSSDAVYFADYILSDGFGRANYVVDMQTAALGIYAIYLIPSDGGKTVTDTVTYLQGDFEREFLSKINGEACADKDAMRGLIEGEDAQTFLKNQLGTLPEDDTILYEYMVSKRPYVALYEVQDAHTAGNLLALFSESNSAKRQDLLTNYGVGYLGIDKNPDMYNMYKNSSRRETICENIPSELKTPEALTTALYESTILTTVKLSNWNEMPAVFEAAKTYLTDVDYDKLNDNLNAVSKFVAGETYESVDDFEKAIRESYLSDEDTGSSKGSSGSRGGSGFVSGVEVGSIVDEYEHENLLFNDWYEIPYYAKSYLERLHSDRVFEGDPDGKFRPNDATLRQEICKILVVGLKPEAQVEDIDFTDVPDDAWYFEVVKKAAGAGYVNGRPDMSFGAGESLTREDLAVILERILKNTDTEAVSDTVYTDAENISDYAIDAVNFVTAMGIMEGYDGAFDPKGQVTRAQAAKVMGKLLYEIQRGERE